MPSRRYERDHAATFPDTRPGGGFDKAVKEALRRPLNKVFGTPEEPTRLGRFMNGLEEGAALSMMAYGGAAGRVGNLRRFTQLLRRPGVQPSTLKKWTNIERGVYGLGVETKGDAYLRPASVYGGINNRPLAQMAWVHPDVLKVHPKMGEVPVAIVPDAAWVSTVERARRGMTSWSRDGSTADGFSMSGGRGIAIRGKRPGEDIIAFNERADRTLVHEMQHVSQDFDGIRPARGHASYDEYRADGREIDARNTANRNHLTPQERTEMPRSMTQDVKANLVHLDDKGGETPVKLRGYDETRVDLTTRLGEDDEPYVTRDSKGAATSVYGMPVRGLYPGEDRFFRENPTVAGMAAEDDAVILNPYSDIPTTNYMAIAKLEAARHWMKRMGDAIPSFDLTPAQSKFFSTANNGQPYGSSRDIQDTIISRILVGDTSAGEVTDEQRAAARQVISYMRENATKLQVQQDDKGGDNFGTFRNFLATDEVPDSLFGYPIAHDENGYTEKDIQFFKENPKAAGFYDLGDEEMEEDVPQQAAKARGTPEDEAIIRMGGDEHGRVRVSKFDKAMDAGIKRVVAETVPGAALLPPVARQVQADNQARFDTWYRGLAEEKRAEVGAILRDPQLSESDRHTMLSLRAPGYPNPELAQRLQLSAMPGLVAVRDGFMLPKVSNNMLRRYHDPESFARLKLNFDLLRHNGSQFRSGDFVVAHSPATIAQTLERIQDLSPDSLWKAGARYFSALHGPVAQEAWNAGYFPFATVYTKFDRLSNHFNATSIARGTSFAPVQLEGVTGLGGPTSRHMSARLIADGSSLQTVPLYFQKPSGDLVLATRLAGGPMLPSVSAAQTRLIKDKVAAAFRDARATVRASALPGTREDAKGGKTRGAYPGSLNNPGNVEKRKERRQGEVESPHKRWAKFATPQDGLREMADAIRQIAEVKLAEKGLPFTIRNFAGVYAPSTENDTAKYVADISADSGFDPDTVLHRFDGDDMARLLRSIVRFESGAPHSAWFTNEEYLDAAKKLQEGAFD